METQVQTKCHFCGCGEAKVNGNHWTGAEYVRVDTCMTHFKSLAKAPRSPRQPKQTVIAYDLLRGSYLVKGR